MTIPFYYATTKKVETMDQWKRTIHETQLSHLLKLVDNPAETF